MKAKTPTDINGKISESRKFLRKYAPYTIISTLAICVYSVISGNDIGKYACYLLTGLNATIIGTPFVKMAAEHFGGKNNVK